MFVLTNKRIKPLKVSYMPQEEINSGDKEKNMDSDWILIESCAVVLNGVNEKSSKIELFPQLIFHKPIKLDAFPISGFKTCRC